MTATSAAGHGPAARAARLAASLARPDVDLRGSLDPVVITQGARPLCVAFAVSGGHEAARSRDGSALEPRAPEAIWWACTERRQTGNAGMLLADAGAVVADLGQPTLADWPYNPCLGTGTEAPPSAAGAPPWPKAVVRGLPLAHDGVEDPLENALATGIPVVLVVEVTEQFAVPDEGGHVETPDLRVPVGGYHAVLCVGAATDPWRGRRLLIRNSWGDHWGLGGYCWLPMAYLVAFVPQAAVVEMGVR
ncbi:C1 family peptidase [Amycolatopsis sp. NBC_01480]|uniref:C1 family peptidase n=1 Tax=Amycolatopsis sp. NBC_01480 TaxID=2903562 RepID=UPI002E295E2C|nr:C1 family peptidase [Amycolatopsis sp. NBC_01480]